MLALSSTDLIQILQAMIAVEKNRGGPLGRAIVINNLQGIMGDSAFLDEVRVALAKTTSPATPKEKPMALEKKHLVAAGLNDALAGQVQAAGIPFSLIFQLLMRFGPAAEKLIEDLVAAWLANSNPQPALQAKAAAPGCCDHAGCCKAVIDAQELALELAYAHYAECCCE